MLLFLGAAAMVPADAGASDVGNDDCVTCHQDISIAGSVHGNNGCMSCHPDITQAPHEEKVKNVDCGSCHEQEFLEHRGSIHGVGLAEGITESAHCYDCHGSHDVKSTSESGSLVHPLELPATCGKCHGDPELARKTGIPIKNPFELYEKSVHHKALLEGKKAATCSECHGSHNIQPLTTPSSMINKANIPKTCSKCHEKEHDEYSMSIHWRAFKKGIYEAPVCNDCHAEHFILSPKDEKSMVYALNIPKVCSDCHERERIIDKYGMASQRGKSYYGGFHGLAVREGKVTAANCASCHGNHNVLTSEDPASPTHPENLSATCGKCHPDIGTKAKIEKVHNGDEFWIVSLVKKVYIWLVLVSVGGMFVFCVLDFQRKFLAGERLSPDLVEPDVIRFNGWEVGLHTAHLVSFFLLVYTGFAHHYPDAVWSSFMGKIFGVDLRAYLHRVSAVVLMFTFGLKFVLMLFTRRGREQLVHIFPGHKDITDALSLLLYNCRLKKERPQFGRFTFYEKFEYWALVWGTFVMVVTGFALWFESFTLNLGPKWIFDICNVVHYYEAVLASLAILIWHFYWVVFDPNVYPLNRSMLTGRMPYHLYEHEHELDSPGKPGNDKGCGFRPPA